MSRVLAWPLIVAALLTSARADEPPARPDATTSEARELYQRATQLVRAAQWYEALGLFERSHQLRPHPVTLFNLAACERALGHYTRALLHYQSIAAATGEPTPATLLGEVSTHIHELEGILAHATVRLAPSEAALAVDGRPLAAHGQGPAGPVLWAGIAPAGPGQPAPGGTFELVLDPGTHLITVTRAGYSPALVPVTVGPGERRALALELARLPARLHVSSDRDRAAISVDGADVGLAPLELTRPPGSYRVVVQKPGFVPYRAVVTLAAGQEAALRASMEPLRTPVWKRWWFWTATGALVAGVALGAYFGARAAEEPRLDGGGLQWVAKIR